MITIFSHACKENGIEGTKNLKPMVSEGSVYFGWRIRENYRFFMTNNEFALIS
jgi:hypothetical protein